MSPTSERTFRNSGEKAHCTAVRGLVLAGLVLGRLKDSDVTPAFNGPSGNYKFLVHSIMAEPSKVAAKSGMKQIEWDHTFKKWDASITEVRKSNSATTCLFTSRSCTCRIHPSRCRRSSRRRSSVTRSTPRTIRSGSSRRCRRRMSTVRSRRTKVSRTGRRML